MGSGGRLISGSRISGAAARMRASVPMLPLDLLLSAAAYSLVLLLRFNGNVPTRFWHAFTWFLPVALLVHVCANWITGLYGQMWRYASIAEARRVVTAGFGSGIVLLIYSVVVDSRMPRSVIIFGALVVTYFLGGLRFQSRLFAFKRGLTRHDTGIRVAIVGAGSAAASLVREMRDRPSEGLVPVVVVDDDHRKHGLSMMGVPVIGSIDDLTETIRKVDAQQIVLAVANADRDLVQRVADSAQTAGVPLKVLASVSDMVRGAPSVRDVRDLRIEDLLGRKQVVTDLDAVRLLLSGRTVLITGAGSIGSEIARQVAQFEPARLVLLDHDETHLHDAAAVLDVPVVQVLADVRDRALVHSVLAEHRPDVVFHAAAHKHVPLLEAHPCEAVNTNIDGTANVLDAAIAVNVERFVFISTDKAVRPASVMGASKWVGEQLVLNRAPAGAKFCSVRFGNVLGSRGSVIPTFARQIAAGGPVTVTHPSMTRFFMSVREAVQLVLQASVFVEGGEVFMLEMGEAINIRDLAERMIRLSGRTPGTEIPIRINGIRPGEKLIEELHAPDELASPTPHASILRLQLVRNSPESLADGLRELRDLSKRRRNEEVRCALFDFVRSTAHDDELVDLTSVERAEHHTRNPSAHPVVRAVPRNAMEVRPSNAQGPRDDANGNGHLDLTREGPPHRDAHADGGP
jgi:FlaA1/EpsC-like NDP-sugar epimerase